MCAYRIKKLEKNKDNKYVKAIKEELAPNRKEKTRKLKTLRKLTKKNNKTILRKKINQNSGSEFDDDQSNGFKLPLYVGKTSIFLIIFR